MIQLHFDPGTASMTPHILLREIGVPFELVRVDRAAQQHKQPAFLKLNPNGRIPVLVDGDQVVYETAAIVLYLVGRFPQAGLAPRPGTAARAQFDKWLVWLTNTPQAMLMHYFYPERMVDPGDEAAAAQVKARAREHVGSHLQQIDEHLAAGGPWMLGADFGALDAYTFMLCRWTRGFSTRPAREFPHIGPFLQRMMQRPALREVMQVEGLEPPWV